MSREKDLGRHQGLLGWITCRSHSRSFKPEIPQRKRPFRHVFRCYMLADRSDGQAFGLFHGFSSSAFCSQARSTCRMNCCLGAIEP